jgi:hypothetical protein
MPQNFNYDDNMFYLSLKVKVLKDGLKLDINNSLFLANFLAEIYFIAENITKVSDSLKSSGLVVGRVEHCKNLTRLEKQFTSLLTDILHKEILFTNCLEENFDRFKKIMLMLSNDMTELKHILSDEKAKSEEDRYIISEEEYKVLLSTNEEV